MAIGCRIAKIGSIPVSSVGTVVNKRTASIGEMADASHQLRVLEDTTNAPNSANNPTIEEYILLEALQNYKVQIINQTWIITYNS